MVANKLKNLVSLTRQALRDVRQTVDEALSNLERRASSPQPALVRVPVRSNPARNLRSPFASGGYGARSFSSAAIRNNSTFNNQTFKQFSSSFKFSKRVPKNFATRIWPYSAFRRPIGGCGSFPCGGLYRNFVGLNSRNFSTYGGNFSREAVQNLTSSLRCLYNNGGDTLLNANIMKTKSQNISNHYLSYNGCATQNEAPRTFSLARTESSDVQRFGSYVEFALPQFKLSIPTVSFMNDEILDTIESDFEKVKQGIAKINASVQLISDAYGSLPLERRKDAIRIHFPNLEDFELEKFLIELGIDNGVVHTNQESSHEIVNSVSDVESSLFLDDFMNDVAPELITSDSESDSESIDSRIFMPVLSSDGWESPSAIDFEGGSEIFINDFSTADSYSDISV